MSDSRVRRLARVLRFTPLHPQWLLGKGRPAQKLVSSLTVGKVLDIGCADRWVESALPPGCHYIGLDYPITGGELYGATPDIFANAACLPMLDASIDTIVMLEVLEHIKMPEQALSEVSRVLRPGGRFVLSVPFLYPIHDAPHDYQRLTAYGLQRDLAAAGLRLRSCKPTLGSSESAGLLACLSLGGMAMVAIKERKPSVLLIPLIAVAVFAINLSSWALGKVLPMWPAFSAGYLVDAYKPK